MDGKEYAVKIWGTTPEIFDSWGEVGKERWDIIADNINSRIDCALEHFSSVEVIAEFLNSCGMVGSEEESSKVHYKKYAPAVSRQYEKAARRFIKYLQECGKLTRQIE